MIPVEHSYHRFLNKKVNQAIRMNSGQPFDVILLGDSIFSHVQRESMIWGPFSSKYKILNLGSPGDRTEHVLYRLSNRDLMQAIGQSKVVVVMVGTNNVGIGDSSDSVLDGITLVVQKVLQEFTNDVHVIVFSVLPRQHLSHNEIIININNDLVTRFQGSKNVHVLDLFGDFYENKHKKQREKMYMPDHLHPSAKGYEKLVDSISPYLEGHFSANFVKEIQSVAGVSRPEEQESSVAPEQQQPAISEVPMAPSQSELQQLQKQLALAAQQTQAQAVPVQPIDPNVPTHYENWSN